MAELSAFIAIEAIPVVAKITVFWRLWRVSGGTLAASWHKSGVV